MPHVDEWLHATARPRKNEAYAKFVIYHMRLPSLLRDAFWPWMKRFELFCTFKRKRWRVTQASIVGDLRLVTRGRNGEEKGRWVDVADCTGWSDHE
ncbi:MAG: hypothetical protein E6Q97_16320 [Desulfurellales bacterium]|nr:MAG: hypothetical protein E6Q97_16320 [Desulfurellales bacterium]